MPSPPLLSVVLVSWNSGAYLNHCLSALSKQSRCDFEVILVDNRSTDRSLDELERIGSDLRLTVERLPTNLGFAAANNIGARLARGKWIALLNADAFPEPDWLEKLLQTAEANPEYSFFSSRQVQANKPELMDGAGDVYHISGLAWRHYYNLPSGQYGLQPEEVFSACGAAALYLREDFLQLGGFDEDYFSYFEDVDLGFRLHLAGKKCLYIPDAVVHHVGSASTGKRSNFSVYYGYRNMIWTFFKNMPSPLIWFLLPLHILTLLFFVIYLSMRGQGKVILRAIRNAVLGMPNVMKKRRHVQRNRRMGSSDLLQVMSTGLLEPYREFILRNRTK
jgi:GT2 family glycosyltransferase